MASTKLNCFSPLAFFSTEQLQEIHNGALEILEDTGCELHHEEAVRLLKNAGAFTEGKRVYLTPGMVENALKSAPSRVLVYDGDGKPAMDLSGRNAYFGTGSDCIYLRDSFSGERRVFTEHDQIDAVRLADALPNIDFLMSMGMISGVNPQHQCQRQYANMIKYSKKPQVVIAVSRQSLDDVAELAASVLPGGREELKRKPRFVFIPSPLPRWFTALKLWIN